MDHLNIARVLDAGSTETGRPYFVMELVHGMPITQYCDENRLTPHERLELFVPVCQAIQHAHQKGIIHRDLKPSNIMICLYDGKPVPKVIDFGVAKAVEQRLTERTLFTQYGSIVGTFEYMSPEQAEMSQLGVDTRSDIYALGVLLYELLTGTTPLERKRLRAAALDELLRLIREEEPPRPSLRLSTSDTLPAVAAARKTEQAKLAKLVKGELDWIVMKCLEKDRTRRYETASGLARDLQRYLTDEPVEACPPSAGYKLRKLARKYRKVLATAAVFVGLLVLGAVVSTWLALQATGAEREAQVQRDAAEEARETAEKQRQLAQEKEVVALDEAAKAKAVVGLLQELLGTANPDAAKGSEYTVRQMLEDFETGFGARLKDQPEVEADLRTTIGLAYSSMLLSDKADKQFRRALELRRQVFGSEHRKVAETLTQLAWNSRFRYLLPGAEKPWSGVEKEAREALAILRRLGDRSENLARALLVHAWAIQDQEVYTLRMKLGQAETTFREALAVAEQCAGGGLTPVMADVCHALAECLQLQGRVEEAKPFAVRAVEIHRRVHGDKHPETGWGLLVLGHYHRYRHEFADAERAYREALTILRRAYGSNPNLHATFALRLLVFVLDAQYKDEETEAILRECESAWQKPDLTFPTADQVLSMRAVACLHRGDYADAERHYRRALEVGGKTPGIFFDVMVSTSQFGLGVTLFLQGKQKEARAALRRLVPMAHLATLSLIPLRADSPLDSWNAAVLMIGGSGQTEDLQAALRLAQRGVQWAKDKVPEAPEARANALTVLAVAQQMNGDGDGAIESLRRALALARPLDLLGRRLPETRLVQYLKEKGDLGAVEKVLRDALSQHQTALPKGHPEIAAAQVNLAVFLTDRKQHAEAEPLLLAAYESLRAHSQATSTSLKRRRTDALERLVQLYDAWGKADVAAKWRGELKTLRPS
jgi:tetratricopeptide (TPR) repeat protein